MGNLLLANGLSLVFTTAALGAMYVGPRHWRLTALWGYLVIVDGTCLGVVLFGPPSVPVAQLLECVRAALVVTVGLQAGAGAARRSGVWGAQREWGECLFTAGCFASIGAVLLYASIAYGNNPPQACYRNVGLVDFTAAAVLLTIAWRMREHVRSVIDQWALYGLGTVYALYAVYRLVRQFDERAAQVFGWLGTLSYCAVLAAIALSALDDWHREE